MKPLEEQLESVRGCRRCALHASRTQVVFGVGNPHARLMFVGEAPGFHEDRQGEPFVGAAGKLLTELLGQIGLTRADVYIANVLKCRPPENRDPTAEEVEACSPNLMEQAAAIRPVVICTLGRFATRLLAATEAPMSAIRGKVKRVELNGIQVDIFPVFHPAAALYTPANRALLEEDFRKLKVLLAAPDRANEQSLAHGGSQVQADDSQADDRHTGSDPAGRRPVDSAPGSTSGSTKAASSSSVEQLPLW
jgi:uracil-DNA glycosylase